MKKYIIITILIFITSMQSIFASNIINENGYSTSIYREYTVNEDKKESFYKNLDETIIENNIEYRKADFNISGGKESLEIEISDTKEIITKTNSFNEILNNLPKTIEYNKDGYIGINNLDVESIVVNQIYNGYYEEYVDEKEQYFDLDKNDMDYIQKEIQKDNLTLYLINVDWYTQTTKLTGDNEITDLYRAEALYRGVKRIENPFTYRVIARYKGIATKEIDNPYIYRVRYDKIENLTEIKQEREDKNVIPMVTGVTGVTGVIVIVIVIFINSKKVKIYNLQYGKYEYLGSCYIKNGTINLDKFSKKVIGNKFKITLNNSALRKYNNKNIKIVFGNLEKTQYIVYEVFEMTI